MQTLELECPSCSELLELDVGFAGGVCRCSSCGTLMTVPDEAGAGPEKLSRPDRPDDPGSISTLSASDMVPAPSQRPESPETRSRPASRSSSRGGRGRAGGKAGKSKGKGKGKNKAQAKPEPIETGEYRTASGKTIRIDRNTKVPTARQRKGIRIATGIVFMGIVLAIAVTAIVLVIVLYKPPTQDEINQEQAREQAERDALKPAFTYSRSANPLELDDQNILGLAPTPPTAIVYQADSDNDLWRDNFAALLGGGLSKAGNPREVALFAATSSGVKRLGSGPASSFKADAVAGFITGLEPSDRPSLAPAIADALKIKPTTLVLVVAKPDDDALNAWTDALKGHEELTVHVVLIDDFSSSLESWQRGRSDGRYVTLTRDQLEDWVEEAAEK